MLQSLSDMLSWRVRTADKTAALSDILFDPDSRQMTYLSLRPGGVSGRQVLASASRLGKTDPHAREVELRITPEELETAPSWGGDADELSALLTAMPPLVVGPFGATHAPLAMAAFAGESGEDEADMPPDPRAEEALDRYTRLTRWLGREVFARDAELGTLSDILADPVENRLAYFIVDNGKFFGHEQRALPVSALAHRAPVAKGGHIVLDVTAAEFETAPHPDALPA